MNKTELINWIMETIRPGDVVKVQIGRFTKNDDEPRMIKKKVVIDDE